MRKVYEVEDWGVGMYSLRRAIPKPVTYIGKSPVLVYRDTFPQTVAVAQTDPATRAGAKPELQARESQPNSSTFHHKPQECSNN